MLGLMFGPPVVWPCAAGVQKAYLFGTVPPFLKESTCTFSVAAIAGTAISAAPAASNTVALTFPMFPSRWVLPRRFRRWRDLPACTRAGVHAANYTGY